VTPGGVEMRPIRLDVVRLVRELVDARRAAFARAGIALHVEAPGEMLCVEGDDARLGQVLDGLLDNAMRSSRRGGRVVATVARQGSMAVVAVGDEGGGGERSAAATVVALAEPWVRMHLGRVEHRRLPGGGSSFAFHLPLAPEPPALAAQPRSLREDGDKGLRVLLIEDNRDAADTLRMLLDFAGHDVDVAYRGDEGFRAAVEAKPDVVVSDIGLPGMDGYEIARELRKREDMARTRLIAVTGYGQEESRRLAEESGFEACFVKPVDPMRLLSHIAGEA
jgi:CheY-like chemotaxis protein